MIFLGKIVKVRGNKGEVVVATSPDVDVEAHMDIFPKGEVLVLKSEKYQRECSVEYSREIRGNCVLKFTDTNSINDALKFIGYSIYGTYTGAQKSKKAKVVRFIVKDTQNYLWGEVKNMETYGLNQILEIEDSEGDIIYVPFADSIVKKIDEEEKLIIIDPPEGLMNLNKK